MKNLRIKHYPHPVDSILVENLMGTLNGARIQSIDNPSLRQSLASLASYCQEPSHSIDDKITPAIEQEIQKTTPTPSIPFSFQGALHALLFAADGGLRPESLAVLQAAELEIEPARIAGRINPRAGQISFVSPLDTADAATAEYDRGVRQYQDMHDNDPFMPLSPEGGWRNYCRLPSDRLPPLRS